MRWSAPGHDWARHSMLVTCVLLLFVPTESYDMDDYDVLVKRPQRFSFGLGKRSGQSSEKYPGLLKGWGMGGPHGLFKRSGKEDLQQWDHIPIGTRGWWGLSGPHGLFKKSGVMEPIKRGAYSFGLGKRGGGQYSFGLGKRGSQYNFGLG